MSKYNLREKEMKTRFVITEPTTRKTWYGKTVQNDDGVVLNTIVVFFVMCMFWLLMASWELLVFCAKMLVAGVLTLWKMVFVTPEPQPRPTAEVLEKMAEAINSHTTV